MIIYVDIDGTICSDSEKNIEGKWDYTLSKPRYILEIGMYKGATTEFICKFIEFYGLKTDNQSIFFLKFFCYIITNNF